MAKMKHFPPGLFSWVDLATSDDTGAIKFYGELLGWKDSGEANKENGFYHIMKLGDGIATAIYPLTEDMQKRNVPPHWDSYIQVENADEMAKKAESNGADVFMKPFDVFDAGRLAGIKDPTGAVFHLWQPNKNYGATPMDNKPGTFCWNELLTPDLERAKTFYTQTFGWELKENPGPAGPYMSISSNGRQNGGMMKIPNPQVPPHWNVYWTVENCDASVKKAEQLGAKILMPGFDMPEVGRIAAVQDPQGATFCLISLLTPDET